MNRMYVVNGFEYNRKEFISFLLTLIQENELYDLAELSNATTEVGIERRVNNRPLHVAYEIFGKERVVTYCK